jgi:hypothetical protein
MSKKLFVGCRVRLVGKWEGEGPNPEGHEGRISACGEFIGCRFGVFEWEVCTVYGQVVVANSDDLEPIEPPHEASDYTFRELMDRLKTGEVECV